MINKNDIVAQFRAEHESVMLSLSVEGQYLGVYSAVDFYRALFTFARESGAVVCIASKARCVPLRRLLARGVRPYA